MVGVGQRCVARITITDVELLNARDIKATIVSPQGEGKCQEVSFDELSGVVYVAVDVTSVGAWSMWLEVRLADAVVYTPKFVFAEVDGEAKPCDAPYVVDVEVAGESVTVTPPHIDVDGGGDVSREEFDALAKEVEGKMPTTLSGDPMHAAYEAIGAKWNANTGYWEFYDMKDITNAEMSKALARGSWYIGASAIGVLSAQNEHSLSAIRFNLARTGGWSVSCDMDDFAINNRWIEFINLTFDNNLVNQPFTYASYLQNSFVGCSNLRRIYGEINVLDVTKLATPFTGCAKLEDVQIYGLKQNISFADCPRLSKESLLYLIDNCASGVSFTITLHPDVDDKCQTEWLEDIDYALGRAEAAKNTNITLARA